MNRILIVEDEMAISDLIKIGLESQGYKCEIALDGEKAADFIEQKEYDLVLLDIMLPKVDGYELLEYIKQTKQIPVIFITAKSEVKDKVKGLKEGADDYITKPFDMEELVARVYTVLRRYNKLEDIIVIDNVIINVVARTVKNGESEIIIEISTKSKEKLLRELNDMGQLTQINCLSHDGECRI